MWFWFSHIVREPKNKGAGKTGDTAESKTVSAIIVILRFHVRRVRIQVV